MEVRLRRNRLGRPYLGASSLFKAAMLGKRRLPGPSLGREAASRRIMT